MPITLNDYASLIKDDLALGFFKNMQRMNPVLQLFPVVEVGSLVVKGERWDTLPTHAFRKLNAEFTDTTGTTEPVEDKLAIYGGKFAEDEAYDQLKEKKFRDPVDVQFDMHAKANERGLMDHIINGDIDSTPDGFEGLYKRFSSGDFPSGQIISVSGTTDSAKVLANAAAAQNFFNKFDEALYAADLYGLNVDGTPKGACFMNKATYLGIQQAAKLTGWEAETVSLLGMQWKSYGGIPFIDAGYKRDQSTEIITSAYDPGDGGNDSSRIYIVRFTAPDGDIDSPGSDGLTLVQAGGLRRLGPIAELTSRTWGMEWILGMAHVGDDYCAALLDDFKMAAS